MNAARHLPIVHTAAGLRALLMAADIERLRAERRAERAVAGTGAEWAARLPLWKWQQEHRRST